MNIVEYFLQQKKLISSNPFVHSWEYQEDIRTSNEGYFKARLHFIDESVLHFREYVNISFQQIGRFTYSFHYQKDQKLIFRYDNTPHHPQISSFPHHKHLSTGEVVECQEPQLSLILSEIEDCILAQ